MPTTIGQLWIPAVWIPAIRERQATFPALFTSGIVVRSPLFDQIASGPGIAANVPLFRDITDTSDEIQVENTAPTVDNTIGSALQLFAQCNRVTKYSSTALAKQLSGDDPMGAITDQIADTKLKQRQKTLVAMLRGLFASAGAADAAGALSAVRYVSPATSAEIFIENGAAAGEDNLFSPDVFINAKALMGELSNTLVNGCLLVHTNIKARLEILDSLNFKTAIMPSEIPYTITTYRGIPIFTSDSLVRDGTGGGYVYDSYLIAKGTVGYGEKPQQGDTIDVASLQYLKDPDLNNEQVWDRSRFLLGVAGTKWVGTAANLNNGPSNVELQTPANWNLVFATANRVGAVCIRTNG